MLAARLGGLCAMPERAVRAESDAGGSLTLVIPARDEENNLRRLLGSLREQDPPPEEVIVVDDESTDRTAEVARELGATVLAGRPLPEGWKGKPWACQQGAEAASGDWLLFLDADTWFEPDGLARLRGLAQDPSGVHSVCPWHVVKRPYEQLSALFNVIMLLGMNAFTLKGGAARDIGLFGQAMLISRQQYDGVGGHERVKAEVLENFHLARHLPAAGGRCHCWLGRGTLRMRMFPGGVGDLVAGWTKGFLSGARNTPAPAVIGVALWISAMFTAFISLCVASLAPATMVPAALLYLLVVVQAFYLFRQAGRFWFLSAVIFPVGLLFYHGLLLRAVYRKRAGERTQWKGRDVD